MIVAAALLAILLLTGCGGRERAPPPLPRDCVQPLVLSSRDLMTPESLSAVRHLNAELRSRCP